MKLDPSQQAAVEAMNSGDNIFLTGQAGTGKSTVVASFLGQAFRRVDVCATTGIAAINLRDQFFARAGVTIQVHTIYRWAGIGLGPRPGQTDEEYARWMMSQGRGWSNAERRIRSAEVLVLDEVSMLPGRILDFVEFLCRVVRQDDRPFGGIQVIAVGDFLQLPPVSKSGVYDWAFLSRGWERAGFEPTVLRKIHRQADPTFTRILNEVREGRVSARGAEVLKSRVARFPDRNLLRLMTHNTMVDRWNAYQMDCIDGDGVAFEAATGGAEYEVEFLRKNLVTPARLLLKVGARVMVTANLSDQGQLFAVNGALGTVLALAEAEQEAVVRLDDGNEAIIGPHTWNFDPQRQDSATFTQLPLRPAWAVTIHKSQGLSLPSAMIDVRAAREPGQAYVALSRVRSLGGLYLKDWFKGLWVSPEAVEFHREIDRGGERAVGTLAGEGAGL
jgi:ATP-dependent DNA helicase PIF1